jgi:hypothetical protein
VSDYSAVLSEAIKDVVANGFDSLERITFWTEQLNTAAESMLISDGAMETQLRDTLRLVYKRLVLDDGLAKYHPGMSGQALRGVQSQLQSELDRRVMVALDLVRLSRQTAIQQMLRSFVGWATSVPEGGGKARPPREMLRKSFNGLAASQRGVLIDQGHKLTSAINHIVAVGSSAIAARWHSHWRQPGYNYREDHKERDELVYAIRDNWAILQGLMTRGAGYLDAITQPGEERHCRCYAIYLYNLRQLPEDMLTKKGVLELDRVRKLLQSQGIGYAPSRR